MGTSREWAKVFLAGGFWGLWMMFWAAHRRTAKNLKPAWCLEEVLTWSLMGLWFGVVSVFPWRQVFRTPLVFITVGSPLCVFLASALLKGRHDTH